MRAPRPSCFSCRSPVTLELILSPVILRSRVTSSHPVSCVHAINRSALSGARTLEELPRGGLAARAHALLARGHGRPAAIHRAHSARGRRLRSSVGKYNEREGRVLDFSRGWWHPPVSPKVVFDSESAQIERRFDLAALVSVTDHNDIRAGLDLQDLYANRRAPISCEWTVPYGAATSTSASTICRRTPPANGWRASAPSRRARAANHWRISCAELNGMRETLIVFCHPLWDLAGVVTTSTCVSFAASSPRIAGTFTPSS